MSSNNIVSIICKSSAYVDKHGSHYYDIFLKYSDDNIAKGKELFTAFIDLSISLQLFIKHKKFQDIATILSDIKAQQILLTKIKNDMDMTDHYKTDVTAILLYFKIISKLIKSKAEIHLLSTFDTSSLISDTCESTTDCIFYKKKHHKCHKTTSNTTSHHKHCKSSSDSSTHVHNHNKPHSGLTFNECLKKLQFDKQCLEKAEKHLKMLFETFNMLHIITCGVQKDHFRKINAYNLCDPSSIVNTVDVEYQNKLLDIYYTQFLSVAASVFRNDNSDTYAIKLFFSDGDYFTLCILDNFRIRKVTTSNTTKLLIDVGKSQYVLTYLRDGENIEASLGILNTNFTQLQTFIYSILSNQKLIKHWLCTTNNMLNQK